MLVAAVRLKAGKLPFCRGRFKDLRTAMLRKIPPLLVGDVGEKFCLAWCCQHLGADAVGPGMLGWQP